MMITNGLSIACVYPQRNYNWWGEGPILWEKRALFQTCFVRNHLKQRPCSEPYNSASNEGLCHWSRSAWWGTEAQRQKLLQGTGKPQAEGGPESALEGEAGALTVLEGSTEVKVGVYKTTGWAFAYGWANSLQDRKSVRVWVSRNDCFMPSFRLPFSQVSILLPPPSQNSQINNRVMHLPTRQGQILQACLSRQPLAATGGHRGSVSVFEGGQERCSSGREPWPATWREVSPPARLPHSFPSLAVELLVSQAVILPSQAGLEGDVAVCPLRLVVAASHYCHVAKAFMTLVQA